MKAYWIRIGLSAGIVAGIGDVLVARQLYTKDLPVYANETSYNLQSIGFFMIAACTALSIRVRHEARIPGLMAAAAFLFDMIKELTSLNDQNDVFQWLIFWLIMGLTFAYGITERRNSRQL